MKLRVVALLLLISLLSGSLLAPVSAADSFPMPPQPKWWAQSGLTDVRYGIWLPCNAEWGISNDCVQGINLYKLDGSAAGPLTYQPLKGFEPSKAVQEWVITQTPGGEAIENSARVKDLMDSIGHWKLPD
ncbi:MAG: hypothetical protein F2781_00525, partial [Actinobacteria bacterium]|nr:hypothetical protein [Actinomycetota bacterium]